MLIPFAVDNSERLSFIIRMTSESIKTFLYRIIGLAFIVERLSARKEIAMARLKSYNCLDGRKPFAIFYYMWLEMCVWCFMTYTSVYYGKIFDYKHIESADFADEIGKGDNLYYRLMFGNLNLTSLNDDARRQVQGKVKLFR